MISMGVMAGARGICEGNRPGVNDGAQPQGHDEVRRGAPEHPRQQKGYETLLPAGRQTAAGTYECVMESAWYGSSAPPDRRGRCTPAIAGTSTTTRTRRDATLGRACGATPPNRAHGGIWRAPSSGARSQSSLQRAGAGAKVPKRAHLNRL